MVGSWATQRRAILRAGQRRQKAEAGGRHGHGLRLGTDCSGLEVVASALVRLGVVFSQVFACDASAAMKAQLLANHSPATWYDDVLARDNAASSTPEVDVYASGFPCQPFSSIGLRQGFSDPRGAVFDACLDYIDKKLPRTFLLEDVQGLMHHNGGRSLERVVESLRAVA